MTYFTQQNGKNFEENASRVDKNVEQRELISCGWRYKLAQSTLNRVLSSRIKLKIQKTEKLHS